MEYIFSGLSVCPNPCVGHLSKMSFFMLSIFAAELMSARKIVTFFHVHPDGYAKNPFLLNPIPYPKYLYLSTSTCSLFLISTV